jgi:hypothetical protein
VLDLNNNVYRSNEALEKGKREAKSTVLLRNTSSKYLDLSKFHSKQLAHLEPDLVNSLRINSTGD